MPCLLFCVFPQISTLVMHFSIYYTQALEEGIEIAVAFERKESYLVLLYSV